MKASLQRTRTSKKLSLTLNSTSSSQSLGSHKRYLTLVTPEMQDSKKKTFKDIKKQVTGRQVSELRTVQQLVKNRTVLNNEERIMKIKKQTHKDPPFDHSFQPHAEATTARESRTMSYVEPNTPIFKLMNA